MKTGKRLITILGAAICLTACDTEEPIYETAHPAHGKITLTMDWSGRTSGLDIPASYTVGVGSHTATLTGSSNTIDHLFEPGSYTVYAYNTADNVTVSGTIAAANYQAGLPGWFYSCALDDVAVEKDKVHAYTAVMRQQVRQLTLVITPAGGSADRIATITAMLSGVAGTVDIHTGTHGTAVSIPLPFTKDTDGKWTTTARLLGIIEGGEQKLSGTIHFADSVLATLPDMTLESDLTGNLITFNTEKNTPLLLGGATETPSSTGFTATIKNWVKDAGSGTAD